MGTACEIKNGACRLSYVVTTSTPKGFWRAFCPYCNRVSDQRLLVVDFTNRVFHTECCEETGTVTWIEGEPVDKDRTQ